MCAPLLENKYKWDLFNMHVSIYYPKYDKLRIETSIVFLEFALQLFQYAF